MTFKTLLFSFILMTAFSAQAAVKNTCDDMIASGKFADDKIQSCLKRLGESDTYKDNQKKKKWQEDTNAAKTSEAAARKANIETKKFTEKEIEEAGFGAIFAVRVEAITLKEKSLTKGDALCSYLGYQKALQSIYSGTINPELANQHGFVISTNFLGVKSKEPELYIDKDEKYYVRKYKSIICAKVISTDVEGTSAELEKAVEDVIANSGIDGIEELKAPAKDDKNAAQNDGPRKPAEEGKTSNGYKRPDWATQVPAQNIAK